MLKSDVRILIQQALDDASASYWSASNLDKLTGLVYDELWTDILDYNPFYLSTNESITTTPKLVSPGYVDLTQLAQRFHRIQTITRNNRHYIGQHPLDTLMYNNAVLVGADYTYRLYGDQLWLFPLEASTALELRYNYKPPLYTGLADGATVTFPTGHEATLIYKTASRAMIKGGREDNASLLREYQEAFDKMLSTVTRRVIGPQQPYDPMHAIEFGGI